MVVIFKPVIIPAPYRGTNINYGSVTVGTSATKILSSNADRLSVMICNVSANDVYIGDTPAVSTANGIKVPPGATITIDWTTTDIYGIAGASSDVRYFEEVK